MEGYIGQVILFAGNFAPRAWAFCAGQLLSIAQNTALFSILGTTYGGNGQTTFALPDLRGCVPVGPGQGPGLTDRTLGERGGQEAVLLTEAELPAHAHRASGSTANANSTVPTGRVLGAGPTNFVPAGDGTLMAPAAIRKTGGDQAHNNMQPWLGLNYIICLEGIYPSRN
jgi:microcystin-dependent protein